MNILTKKICRMHVHCARVHALVCLKSPNNDGNLYITSHSQFSVHFHWLVNRSAECLSDFLANLLRLLQGFAFLDRYIWQCIG